MWSGGGGGRGSCILFCAPTIFIVICITSLQYHKILREKRKLCLYIDGLLVQIEIEIADGLCSLQKYMSVCLYSFMWEPNVTGNSVVNQASIFLNISSRSLLFAHVCMWACCSSQAMQRMTGLAFVLSVLAHDFMLHVKNTEDHWWFISFSKCFNVCKRKGNLISTDVSVLLRAFPQQGGRKWNPTHALIFLKKNWQYKLEKHYNMTYWCSHFSDSRVWLVTAVMFQSFHLSMPVMQFC